ncbi:MAG: ribonuclease Z, partial [Flavobacteriales bacterium]
CSDTVYKPNIIPIIKNADLLYHEATFLADKEELAKKTKHSTSKEAAQIAKDANVGQLVVGHYSGRYKNIDLFKEEAQEIFENSELAIPGKVFTIQ